MPVDVLSLFRAEIVFSICFFLGFIGFGVWFARSVWPWLTKFLELRQDLGHSLEKQRVEAEAKNDAHWQDTANRMASALEANTQALIKLAERQPADVKCPFVDSDTLLEVLKKLVGMEALRGKP